MARVGEVRLVAIDEVVLPELVRLAVADCAPDEVTPPLTSGLDWTPERIDWLRALHRDRRRGLAGPAGEATWAIMAGDRVAGSIRLKRCAPGVGETGIWLACGVRDSGVGTAAVRLVLDAAAAAGLSTVQAETRAANAGALRLLRLVGFLLDVPDSEGRVQARWVAGDERRRPAVADPTGT